MKFGIYKNGTFNERLYPFGAIARVIDADDWALLERGLAQRVDTLNAYLADVYGIRQIIADGIVRLPDRPDQLDHPTTELGERALVGVAMPTGGVFCPKTQIGDTVSKTRSWQSSSIHSAAQS